MTVKSITPLSLYQLTTLGGQLEVMLSFARAETAEEVRDMWPPVQDVFEHYGLSQDREGLPPLRDRVIDEFKAKVLDVTRPSLDSMLGRLAAYPHPAVLQWQRINRKELHRCFECNIISEDVVRLFTTAVLRYDEEMQKTLTELNLGERLKIVCRFLTAKDFDSEELMDQFGSILAFYNLPQGLMRIPSKLSPDSIVDYKGRMLTLLRPHVESDVIRRGLSLSNDRDFKDVGLSDDILRDALASGILSQRVLHRMASIRHQAVRFSAEVIAQREEISKSTEALSWRRSALLYCALAAGGLSLVNGAGIFCLWKSASPLGVLWCVVNMIVSGLLVAFSTGLWRPYEKEVEQPAMRKTTGRVEKMIREKDKIIMSRGSVDRDAPTIFDDGAEDGEVENKEVKDKEAENHSEKS